MSAISSTTSSFTSQATTFFCKVQAVILSIFPFGQIFGQSEATAQKVEETKTCIFCTQETLDRQKIYETPLFTLLVDYAPIQ